LHQAPTLTDRSGVPPSTPVAKAQAEQRAAADPRVSAFVSAHAGTGKTKLLIDRLLRLMLEGADPARILCLTYTKAAAAEMANRLHKRLGAWVTADDAALDAALAALEVTPAAATREAARALFARVLDLPGGMRIGTIHAFCQSLLRRFPLEAEISPHFRILEDADARAALDDAREAALPEADADALAILAGRVGADEFARLLATLEGRRDTLQQALALPAPALAEALKRAVRLPAASDAAAILAGAVTWAAEPGLRGALLLARNHGSPAVADRAGQMLGWLNLPPDLRQEHWDSWHDLLFRKDGNRTAASKFCNEKLAKLHPGIIQACEAEQARAEAVLDQLAALRAAQTTAALLAVARPILQGTAQARGSAGLLDYDELIARTASLLADPGRAAWVLYKLDGGLDHLLLDEVQDTAPAQWQIAADLTGDFFAGAGAREAGTLPRTVFAVGDRKQSIYSFQGADAEQLDRWRGHYARQVGQSGQAWLETVLDVSFRTTAPVLALVDAVFAGEEAAAGVGPPGSLQHIACRTGHAGAVELWPLAPRPEQEPATPWQIPHANTSRTTAPQRLVAELARWIAELVQGGMLPSEGRPVRPGDILVLVRRRGQFDRALVRALKARGVAVAGLDRMVLTEQAAVQDLLALCRALLLPSDDLAFAEFLVSPLGGLHDDDLLALAPDRGEASLWEALRRRAAERSAWRQAAATFATLLARVDFASPYALLAEALGACGGRARLYARLGPDAAEPVDELLAAALHYATLHPPSLQGFLHWLDQSGAEVKRQPEAAGDAVRIMTVHGAKGLEAPVVILPDTTSLPPPDQSLCWTADPQTGIELPLWTPHKDLRCQAAADLHAKAETARRQEYNRLLYVALTRARDRVLVCGWETHRPHDGTWYKLVERAMHGLQTVSQAFGAWPGETHIFACTQTAPAEPAKSSAVIEPSAPPAWAGAPPLWQAAPPKAEPARPRPLAPSRPEGVELGPVPAVRSPLTARGSAFSRGLTMHALLQHLPALPPTDREQAARRFTAGMEGGETLAQQALAVLADPACSALFGHASRPEQPIAGLVGGQIVTGQVDRLAILADEILVADYKTSRAPPASPEAVPVMYLRQMAAYRAVLRAVFPRHRVRCLLVWTDGPAIMPLPDALLDRNMAALDSTATADHLTV
jgi:ATP-dependent helicase/nuclease subunit A